MALARPPASPPQPIYFRVVSEAADALPWELLYSSPQGFFALDPRWPVGRIGTRVQDLNDRSFLSPFRVVTLLSAASRKGKPQLDAIVRAVERAAHNGFDVRLHVITGEQAVFDRVSELNTKRITAQWLASSPTDVARQITDAKPSIVHLLCHGSLSGGVRGLALATTQDFLAGEQRGSVVLSTDMLARALEPCDPWLVVLAACETAEASDGAAFAHSLVDAGIPAVIGMRRLVDLGATNRFCETLYPELLSIVASAVEPSEAGDGARIIDWVIALTAPRQAAIVGVDPSKVDTWSDPVLYAQQDPLRIYIAPPGGLSASQHAELRGRLDGLLLYVKGLDPVTTPPGVRADVEGQIAELRSLLPGTPDV
jgi:hypothetical protein